MNDLFGKCQFGRMPTLTLKKNFHNYSKTRQKDFKKIKSLKKVSLLLHNLSGRQFTTFTMDGGQFRINAFAVQIKYLN